MKQNERLDDERDRILYALYGMNGNFSLPFLADMAGGQQLYQHASRLLRERVASGMVEVVAATVRPRLYRLAEDD